MVFVAVKVRRHVVTEVHREANLPGTSSVRA